MQREWDKSKIFDFAVALLIFQSSLTFMNSSIAKSGRFRGITILNLLIYGIIALAMVINVNRFAAITQKVAAVIFVAILLVAISCLNSNNYRVFVSQGLPIRIFSNLLLLLCVYLIYDYNQFIKYLTWLSIVTTILCTVVFYLAKVEVGYMAYGYRLLPATIILFYYGAYNGNTLEVVLSFIGGGFLLLYGARGSFFIYLAALMAYVILFTHLRYKALILVLGLVIPLFLYVYKVNILEYVFVTLQRYGIYSRTLYKYIKGTIISDSSRLVGWRYYWQLLWSSPWIYLLGLGMAGERYYSLRDLPYVEDAGYAHNIAIEAFLQYGIIGGILFLGYTVKRILRIIISDTPDMVTLTGMAFIACFLQLLFSSSYIQSEFFYLVLGWSYFCERVFPVKVRITK